MDYQFTKMNIMNELSEDAKAYRKRVMKKYERDVFFKESIENILLISVVISMFGISIYIFGETKEKILPLIIFVALCLILLKINEKILNALGLINTIGQIENIKLMKMQINLEQNFVLFANSNYNPIGFEITNRTFEISRFCDDVYIYFIYVAKNLVNLDIVEKKLEFKVSEVVKNCSVIVPTLDITNVKLILPSDENGNLLEELENQSVNTN